VQRSSTGYNEYDNNLANESLSKLSEPHVVEIDGRSSILGKRDMPRISEADGSNLGDNLSQDAPHYSSLHHQLKRQRME